MVTGLSTASLVLAHSVHGTHAMLYSQATTPGIAVSAARDFPSYDNSLASEAKQGANEACAAERDAENILKSIEGAKTSKAAAALIPSFQSDTKSAEAGVKQAESATSLLDPIAQADLTDYQNAERQAQQMQMHHLSLDGSTQVSNEELQQLEANAASLKRVAGWSGPADASARTDLSQAQSALSQIEVLISKAHSAVKHKAEEEAAAAEKAKMDSQKSSSGTQPQSNTVSSGNVAGGNSNPQGTNSTPAQSLGTQ